MQNVICAVYSTLDLAIIILFFINYVDLYKVYGWMKTDQQKEFAIISLSVPNVLSPGCMSLAGRTVRKTDRQKTCLKIDGRNQGMLTGFE